MGWKTINGARVFIEDGQDLADAFRSRERETKDYNKISRLENDLNSNDIRTKVNFYDDEVRINLSSKNGTLKYGTLVVNKELMTYRTTDNEYYKKVDDTLKKIAKKQSFEYEHLEN